MFRISALIALALTSPALAQETVPLGDPQTYETLPTQPITAAPSSRGSFGDWEVGCVAQADCFMTQLHRRTPGEAGTADAVFTVSKPRSLTGPDGLPIEAVAEIVVPLGVYLPGSLGLKVDEQPAKAAPFERCIDEGCVVRAPISAQMLANLKGGNTVYIVIFDGPERPIRIPMSLRGFTAAFESF